MRITAKTQMGIAVIKYLGEKPNHSFTSRTMAGEIGVSELFIQNILSKLAKSKIVASMKGPGGGYRLFSPYSNLRVSDVMEALGEKVENKFLKTEFFSESMAKTLDNQMKDSLNVRIKDL